MGDKHLIANTTKAERERIIKDALALASLGGPPPCEEDMKLFQQYIDGELELDDIKNIIIKKYMQK